MNNLLAQKLKIGEHIIYTIEGPLNNIDSIGDLISRVLSFLFPISGILLFFFLVWGGFDFLMSGGEPEKVQSGRAKISAALIGFFLLIFSLFIVRIIGYIFKLGGGLF